jgi:hypothetical protein
VRWSSPRSSVLVVTFRGRVTVESGQASAARFLELLGTRRVHVVMDVCCVSGYASAARKAWQTALMPQRGQLLSLTIASDSSLTRMGGNLFGTFLGIPHRSVPVLTRELMAEIEAEAHSDVAEHRDPASPTVPKWWQLACRPPMPVLVCT